MDEDEVENNDAPGVGSLGSAASRSATSPEYAFEAGEASGTQALDALLDQLSQGRDSHQNRLNLWLILVFLAKNRFFFNRDFFLILTCGFVLELHQ